MNPFPISEESKKLVCIYPESQLLRLIVCDMPRNEIEGFLRLWITEGIPFAFRNLPIAYEYVREWVSKRLQIHPKQVTVIGSARVGFSMKPKSYGRKFNENSDLDFVIVSEKLFTGLVSVFEQWKKDEKKGVVKPKHEKEKQYWAENFENLPRIIKRGFIDAWKLPNRYSLVIQVNHTMWEVKKKLEITQGAPKVKKATVRVYKDFSSLFKQLYINFENLYKSF